MSKRNRVRVGASACPGWWRMISKWLATRIWRSHCDAGRAAHGCDHVTNQRRELGERLAVSTGAMARLPDLDYCNGHYQPTQERAEDTHARECPSAQS